MVIKTNRLARPFLAIAAIALMVLVALPSAGKAATTSSSYNNQPSLGRDLLYAGGVLGALYLVFGDR